MIFEDPTGKVGGSNNAKNYGGCAGGK